MDEETAGLDVPVVRLVARALETSPADESAQQRALMYAEAIDDADEPDALLRFGPRLEACLEALGVAPVVDLRARSHRRARWAAPAA